MTLEFILTEIISASPEEIFQAWLDSEKHSKMTGGKAIISDQEGESFSAWDGYILGRNLKLHPDHQIIQEWRTTEFEESDPDSLLKISLIPEGRSTRITIEHSNLPAHGQQYKQGWIDAYLTPMSEFFST
ncbi:MAG: SRPBCC domain-containing protein [Anaerolineales bacterium]|nr:SRPBCC domain-containing protein [Anaerolineales bacterium]